ncbi:MAG: c-type cytochrome, partial [Verrucomicrobiae bacterium]|nr:c-type cytochrome [Verrucomicrobiae bacterium]
ALEASGETNSFVAGPNVRLNKGPNPFVIEYTPPSRGDAVMRLYWTNAETPLNPIPLAALSPTTHAALAASTAARTGRDLVYDSRCVRCHAVPADPAAPELAMDAPSFNGIGSRRQVAWMARWIADPAALRPGTPMPRIFHGAEAGAQAEAVAAFLGTLKGAAFPAASPGDAESGKALFEKLHCVACHLPPEGGEARPEQISQKQVRAKFTPGALAAFLQKPEEHFAWIRMPNFKLSAEEAGHLAAYLESVADPADPPAAAADEALVSKGRTLVAASGCLNCHALEGVKNELQARALAELPADRWTAGCLADAPAEGSKAPVYAFTGEQRTALHAWASTDRASLARGTEADFLERQSRHLHCAECHGKMEGFPHWELLRGKLKPEWAAKFIGGTESWKPRPWLEARMPAFPAYASGLARGLATSAGQALASAPDPAPSDAATLAEAGQKLVSANGGFACVSCHGVGEFGATQVFEAPGINLAHSFERLQPEYFRRWIRAPTSIDPESKMPVYFDENGQSPLPEVLEGDGPKTISAVWEYLRLGEKAPRPE